MDDKDFPTIKTGNGFQNDLIATTNDRIKKQVIVTSDLKDTIVELDDSIRSFNEKSDRQTSKLITLTVAIVTLTAILVIGLIIQLVMGK